MKAVKLILLALVGYAAVVVVFESLLGFVQPSGQGTIVVTTFDEDGAAHDRVVSRYDVEGRLYVAANHWPRSWYRRALENPRVEVTSDGETVPHVAVELTEEEQEAVDRAHPLGLFFRVLTGFPPRRILRLDPA